MLFTIIILSIAAIGIYRTIHAIINAPMLDIDEHGFLEFMKPKAYRHKNQKS